MEWITANLADMMSTYWWMIVGTVVGTGAIMSGLVAPIAERLEDARSALAFQAAHRPADLRILRWAWAHRAIERSNLASTDTTCPIIPASDACREHGTRVGPG